MGNGRNTHLRELNLSLNALAVEVEIDFKHFDVFARRAATHQHLLTLNLSYNALGLEAAKAVAQLCAHSPCLRRLDMHGNKLGPAGAAELCKGVCLSSSLEELDLSENDLGDEGAGKAAVMLVMNRSLLSLKLDGNWIGMAGLSQLGSSLAKNFTLCHLSLADNDVAHVLRHGVADVRGLRHLLSLESAQSLTTLDLSNTHIGSEGAKAVAERLMVHPTLTELHLSGCGIEKESDVSQRLVNMMRANPRVMRLHLYRNPLNWGALDLDDDTGKRVLMFEGF